MWVHTNYMAFTTRFEIFCEAERSQDMKRLTELTIKSGILPIITAVNNGRNYAMQIHNDTGMGYRTVCRKLKKARNEGLIKELPRDAIQVYEITELGKKVI